MSPTSRSLAHLRSLGYIAEVVEKTVPRTFIKKDFLGIFDILAIHPKAPGILGVQTTSTSNVSARAKKMLASPNLDLWTNAGCEAVIHGWSKKGPKGKRKLWQLTERYLVP